METVETFIRHMRPKLVSIAKIRDEAKFLKNVKAHLKEYAQLRLFA